MPLLALALLAQTPFIVMRDLRILVRKPYANYGVCLLLRLNEQGATLEHTDHDTAVAIMKFSRSQCSLDRSAALEAAGDDKERKLVESGMHRFDKMIDELIVPGPGRAGTFVELPVIVDLN